MESPLRMHRKALGKSLKDRAAELGIAPSVLCKWEKLRVPAEKVAHVSSVTGIPPHRLRPDVFPERVSA